MESNKLLENYLELLAKMTPEKMEKLVESHLNDEDLLMIIDHLEDFYGVNGEEETGTLAQIFVSGILGGLAMSQNLSEEIS